MPDSFIDDLKYHGLTVSDMIMLEKKLGRAPEYQDLVDHGFVEGMIPWSDPDPKISPETFTEDCNA